MRGASAVTMRQALLDQRVAAVDVRLEALDAARGEQAARRWPGCAPTAGSRSAMTGVITFSSKLPAAPPHAIVASLPITCAQTISSISAITGFTLPGMIELPGCSSGSAISPMPQRGPEPSQRMSLAILVSVAAAPRSAPDASTSASCAASASNRLGAWRSGIADLLAPSSRSRGGANSGIGVDARADRRAAQRPAPTARRASPRRGGWSSPASPRSPRTPGPRRIGIASIRCVRPILTT